MTILPSFNLRQSINIDSLERAILFSALLVRSVCVQGEDFKENIKIYLEQKTVSKIDPNSDKEPKALISKLEMLATVEFSIPYNQVDFLDSGANYLSYLSSLSEIPPEYSGQILSFSQYPLNLQENGLIQNLEQYLVWATTKYCGLLEGYFGSTWKNMGYFSFLDSASVPSFSAKASLIIDFQKYTDTANLLEAIVQTVTSLDPVVYNSVPETELKEWNLWVFGNDLLIGNSLDANTNPSFANSLPTSIPIDFTLSVQNDKNGGYFEQGLLSTEEKLQGWKIKNYTINNNLYSTVNPLLNTSPNTVKINNSNNLEVAELKLFNDRIGGSFARSFYSQQGLSFSGQILLDYKIEQIINFQVKSSLNKKIILQVLPQQDFIAATAPSTSPPPPTEAELLEDKEIYFNDNIHRNHGFFTSFSKNNIFLNQKNFVCLSISINGVKYTNLSQEIDLTTWKLKYLSDGTFFVTRFSPDPEIISLIFEIRKDPDLLPHQYDGEICEVVVTFNFAFLPIISPNVQVDNNTLFISAGDLQNLKIVNNNNPSYFSSDLIYQWDYLKAKNITQDIFLTNNSGTFEGFIRLETPEARVMLTLWKEKGFEICKVPDKNCIFEYNSATNFVIKSPKSLPNWNNGLVVKKDIVLYDFVLSKYVVNSNTVISNQSVNLNLQDLHFAITWSPSGSNFECKLYINGNYINNLIIPTIPKFIIKTVDRVELHQFIDNLYIQIDSVYTANNGSAKGTINQSLNLPTTIIQSDVTIQDLKKIIGVSPTSYGYLNLPIQNNNNQINPFYTIKKKDPDWFLIKSLRLSNLVRYTANFNPQTATYLP